ncbi:hypothetical protein BI043_gp185 [Escherichia phage UFV-AREG1]|uniref:Uncharacterized protein n=1 Tax=Escherichia phage UFV-AREG1 TaxID=1837867 RepID=A0A173GAK0_9CAUD|nr:hypothetical protein BI043_gp185 [Escherichia phage UFV-AREG1]ANH50354.1 hypothetical protein AREG1_00223 [Escherichia phage UFV-AREG1]
MKTLLERYIECSDRYIDACNGAVYMDLDRGVVLNDEDPAKALDDAGKALRKEAKVRGLDMYQLKNHMIKFISSNVQSKSANQSTAELYKGRREHNIRILEVFLGIK